MNEAEVCIEMFLEWLAESHGRTVDVESSEPLGGGALSVSCSDGKSRLEAEVQFLLSPTDNDKWLEIRQQLATRISEGLEGHYALWAPEGAYLPFEEASVRTFVERVRETAACLEPGERSYVPLPASIYLRKVNEEGWTVNVDGGLNSYWARFTQEVEGTFGLDSTRLHRLPESEEHLEDLIKTIIQRSADLQSVGDWTEIETIDAWTIRRLQRGQDGVTIIGMLPEDLGDVGLAVRRNFRRILAAAAPRLRAKESDLRSLIVLGPYSSMKQEGASTALRGYDPALYADLDFICLVADGILKPVIQAPAALLPWSRG